MASTDGARRARRRPPPIRHVKPALAARSATDLARQQEVGAEHPGLLVAALGQLGPADPAREAEVVADQRARAGLAADRLALDDQRAQPLGGGVDRGGQPGRAGADDDHVEVAVAVVQRGPDAPGLAQLGIVGSSSTAPPIAGIHTTTGPVRSSGITDPDLAQRRDRARRAPFEVGVGDAVAGEQAAYAVPPRGARRSATTTTSRSGTPTVRDHSWTNSPMVRLNSSSWSDQGFRT